MEGEITLNDRYRLLERVGSGGMATVYKAQDVALGRIVAVKMLHESLTSDPAFLERFQREAHAAGNLAHPNIVTIHDIGQDGRRSYIVMEFVEGQTLKQLIRDQNQKERPMPVNRALDLTIQICNGIGYAHRANLVHCDLKPQNVLVTRDDRVKVADFGIARALSQSSQQLVEDSQVWGTPQYFAPEQAAGQPATPATDVYAIGIVLFELLCGKTPFQADTPTAVALKHMHQAPPSVSEFNPAVPPQLQHIIEKVLSKEPSGRYRTAGQLGRILASYRERSRELTGPSQIVSETVAVAPVSEQKTQTFERSATRAIRGQVQRQPAGTQTNVTRSARPPSPQASPQTIHIRARPSPAATDWLTISLGILTLISLLGLIPLWYFVYRAWAG